MRTQRSRNEITINGDVAKITLYDRTCNVIGYATIDAEDVDRIKKYKWHKNSQGYVASTNDNKIIRLHRLIMGIYGDYDGKVIVDHINGDKLDNRKSNLRITNLSVNNYNKQRTREGKTGVTKWFRGKQTYYKSYIYVNRKCINIGVFHTEEEARKARRNAEIKYGIDKYIGNNSEVRIGEEPRELVLKPIKDEQGFVNLYKDGGQVKVGWKIFPTKKEAEENFKDDEKYITTANIQWRDSNDNI